MTVNNSNKKDTNMSDQNCINAAINIADEILTALTREETRSTLGDNAAQTTRSKKARAHGVNKNACGGTPANPTTARVYNATTGKWEDTDIHELPAGTVLHSDISNYYRTYDSILSHRVGPWISDIGSTLTSSTLASQIRRQWECDNAYYTAITPTTMNLLSR